VIGAVLCGGRSSRFGTDKALADVAGRPLAATVVTALRDAGADPVVAVGGEAGGLLGLPTIADRWPGAGPLAALATILVWARHGMVVVAPCDLPLLRAVHVRALIERAGPGTAAVAVSEDGGGPQPSLACWPTTAAPAVVALVARGERSWRAALDVVSWTPVVVPAEALADADTPAALAFLLGRPEGSHEEPAPRAP
jgi:molybdenum cofactor guanylyltransferase